LYLGTPAFGRSTKVSLSGTRYSTVWVREPLKWVCFKTGCPTLKIAVVVRPFGDDSPNPKNHSSDVKWLSGFTASGDHSVVGYRKVAVVP
jgi:hypothetical protein